MLELDNGADLRRLTRPICRIRRGDGARAAISGGRVLWCNEAVFNDVIGVSGSKAYWRKFRTITAGCAAAPASRAPGQLRYDISL